MVTYCDFCIGLEIVRLFQLNPLFIQLPSVLKEDMEISPYTVIVSL